MKCIIFTLFFLLSFNYSYSKEYIIFNVSIYPKNNYLIDFLCVKDSGDCIPIKNINDIEELIDWFKNNTFIMADCEQIDDYCRNQKKKDKALADSLIEGVALDYELRDKFEFKVFYLYDKFAMKINVAVINSDFLKATDVGTTSIGIDSDYFLIPYKFKYVRNFWGAVESLFCK
ncbi:MAG: hypothetical protein IK005_03000 [Paludibacteraceae bacterium]|nr:hypothetical protein [Paludibacteraceae bacterium]